MTDFETARLNMVESQIRPNSITDHRVIDAMANVPREEFVPPAKRPLAYMDSDIELAPGRYLMEPMVFARLVQLCEIGLHDLVLDVGCGGGYSTAVLARLAESVVAVEEDENIAQEISSVLMEQGVDNAAVIAGPLNAGLANEGPYDAIILSGQVEQVPDSLLAQLKDGGRLAAIVSENGVGKARLYRRSGDTISDRTAFDANCPKLPGFQVPDPGFIF